MISKLCIIIATLLVAIPLHSGVGHARSVNVEFNLDSPTTGIEKKMFIDRATLEAQSRMLDIYYENISFIPTWSKDPHRGRLGRIMRLAAYRSTTVTGLKATKRKKVGDEWEFAFRGNIPDTPPRVDDDTLTEALKRLIDSKSSLLPAPLAMEIALSYPQLDLFDRAIALWRHIFTGHSHAMLSGQLVLSPLDFEYSARRIKSDMMPQDLTGFFNLLDQAPFNPVLCRSLIPMLEKEKMPGLLHAFSKSCLVLEKTSPGHRQLVALTTDILSSTPQYDSNQIASINAEIKMLEEAGMIDASAWLTRLVFGSLGNVPAKFPSDTAIDTAGDVSDLLELVPLDLAEDSDSNFELEPLVVIDLNETIMAFEQSPTMTTMIELADQLAEAGYPGLSQIFQTQVQINLGGIR